MIIVEIYGGLGNQLFEYANARALALKLNQELFFDLKFFDVYKDDVYRLNQFNLKIAVANNTDIDRLKRYRKKWSVNRVISRKIGFSVYSNTKFHFDEDWFKNNNIEVLTKFDDIYISGYFGGESYFRDIQNIIRNEFTLKNSLNLENKLIEEKIVNTNSISLHIRRGDYVNNKYFTQIPIDYYLKAIDYMEIKFPNSNYFVFSDDIDWVKTNLKTNVNLMYVTINDSTTDYMDLILMASCKHNIIANSTFSWWGAWLNTNPNKIIVAPKKWYDDINAQRNYDKGQLVPSSWIKL